MLVLTCLLYRGLSQLTFLCRLLYCFSLVLFELRKEQKDLYPLSFKAFPYSGLAELKACSLEELLDNLSSVESGRCLIIRIGWFEEDKLILGLSVANCVTSMLISCWRNAMFSLQRPVSKLTTFVIENYSRMISLGTFLVSWRKTDFHYNVTVSWKSTK